jgi:molybdopterin/thiamine biosynthesis adenylyltransferase
VEQAADRLKALNPRLKIECVAENINEENVTDLVGKVDIVFDCAPLFEERFLMNRECVRQGKPLIDAAMYGLQGQVTTILPGKTACLQCIYPEVPETWKRRFPVIGAVSALAGCIAVMEGVKLIAGMQTALDGKMLYFDTESMNFRKVPTTKRADCPVCGAGGKDE